MGDAGGGGDGAVADGGDGGDRGDRGDREPTVSRARWRPHRYLKYFFLDDLDTVQHIPAGRLWGVPISVTPTVWLQGPFFYAIGVVLTWLPGRMPPGAAAADRALDALVFMVAGLAANGVHAVGHIASGRLAGSAMDELLLTATRDANLYRGDQRGIPGRTHIARAVGGPLANLAAAAAAFALLAALGPGGGAGRAVLARLASVNLGFGLGGFLPIPSVDGEVIWREVGRAWRRRGNHGATGPTQGS